MKDTYIVLTGSKNNAGDYLIKLRGKQLLESIRSDRKIIDLNGWNIITDDQLEMINSSKAVILLGGPSLRKNMYPGIYPIRKNLDDIKVPIIPMGIGWKSKRGEWSDTYTYPLSEKTMELLSKINNTGYLSSVRDYHTLNVLNSYGYKNVLMTGCPGYYDLNYINKPITENTDIKKIAFSLGVSFINSMAMEKQMKAQLISLRKYFVDSKLTVVFHHSLNRDVFNKAYTKNSTHSDRHNNFASWLESEKINYVDISGSAENLINFYSSVNLHIGYRVHAHIFMNSISKKSVLLSEDGRGKAVEKVLGLSVYDGFIEYENKDMNRLLRKIGKHIDRFTPNSNAIKDIINYLEYEKISGNILRKKYRNEIDNNFLLMKKFIQQLP